MAFPSTLKKWLFKVVSQIVQTLTSVTDLEKNYVDKNIAI